MLLRLRWWNVPLGAVVIVVGFCSRRRPPSDVPGLFALGVRQTGPVPADWYPVMPWLGMMMIGLAVGLALYPGGQRGPWARRLREPGFSRALGAPGRHSLPIYLVHQPLLIPLVAAALALAGVGVTWGGFG